MQYRTAVTVAVVAATTSCVGIAHSQTTPKDKKPTQVSIVLAENKGYRVGEIVPVQLTLRSGTQPLSGKRLYLYVSENCKSGLTQLSRKVGEYKTDRSGTVKVTDFKASELRELWVYFAPVAPPCLLEKNPLKNKSDREFASSSDWKTVRMATW